MPDLCLCHPGAGRLPGDYYHLYCRLSDAEDGSTVTVDRQHRLMWEELVPAGDHVVRIWKGDNDKSASDPRVVRDDFEELFKLVAAGEVSHIMVYHVDRYIRQPYEFECLLKAAESGLIIRSFYGKLDLRNSDQVFVARVLFAQAANETDKTKRRVRDGLADRVAAGLPLGRSRSYGRLPDGSIVESEARVLHEAAERYVADESFKAIAADFFVRGIRALPKEKTVNGRRKVTPGVPFTDQSLRSTLMRPSLAGANMHKGVEAGRLEPILEPDLAADLWAAIASVRRGRPPTGRYLLTGYVECRTCGGSKGGVRLKERNGDRRVYRCTSEEKGPACRQTITADYLEDLVGEYVKARLADPRYRDRLGEARKDQVSVLDALTAKEKRIQRALADLVIMHTEDEISEADYERALARNRTRLATVRAEIAGATDPALVKAGRALSAAEEWDLASRAQRRRLVEGTIRKVVVSPAPKARKGQPTVFDPSRVEVVLLLDSELPAVARKKVSA